MAPCKNDEPTKNAKIRFAHPCVKMIIISLVPRSVNRSNVPIDTYLWLEYFVLIMVLLCVSSLPELNDAPCGSGTGITHSSI